MNNAPFRRPRRTVSRYGDPRRVWRHVTGAAAVVETVTICGVAVRRRYDEHGKPTGPALPVYHAVLLTETGESLVSVHRKLNPALAAVVRALRPAPKKRKKVRG